MARLLVATVPLTGHVAPMMIVVRALVARGHTVTWCAPKKFAARIADTGARVVPMEHADWDDSDAEAAFPALRGRRGLSRVRTQLDAMFIAPALDQLRELSSLAEGVDAVLADQAHLGAAFLAEQRSLPWIQLGISALGIPSIDTAPFGTARPPARGAYDRATFRFLRWLVDRVLFRGTNRAYRDARRAAGLPDGDSYFSLVSPDLFLQPTVPGFEYPRSDLPSQVRFIGPLVPPASSTLPVWWRDVLDAHAQKRPIILVTQGTLATDARELIAPALNALASLDALVIATTPASLTAPANARVASFVPYQALLPYASAMVTNGGYGGVQMALAAGVPLVIAGGSEEKPEIAARVAWSGAGIDLRTGRPRSKKIRRAVERVLTDANYAERARAIAKEMAGYDAPLGACLAIEQLLAKRTERLAA